MTRLTRRGWIVVGALLAMAAMAIFGQWTPILRRGRGDDAACLT